MSNNVMQLPLDGNVLDENLYAEIKETLSTLLYIPRPNCKNAPQVFEEQILDSFRNLGFIEISRQEVSKEDRDRIRQGETSLDIITDYSDQKFFVYQPVSDYDHPDILIGVHGKVIYVECKTTTSWQLMLGDTVPHEHTIYLIAGKIKNKTPFSFNIIVRGKHLVNRDSAILKELAAMEEKHGKERKTLMEKVRKQTGYSKRYRAVGSLNGPALRSLIDQRKKMFDECVLELSKRPIE